MLLPRNEHPQESALSNRAVDCVPHNQSTTLLQIFKRTNQISISDSSVSKISFVNSRDNLVGKEIRTSSSIFLRVCVFADCSN